MKHITIFFTMVLVLSFAGTSISNMGEKHHKKESAHEMSGEEHEKMDVLHESMEELNVEMDKIFHAIISSNFSGLVEMSGTVRRVAEELKGTKPHKNLEEIDQYHTYVGKLQDSCEEFERAVEGQNPNEITESFGNVVSICVGCHTQFRD